MKTTRRYTVSIPDARHWREQMQCQSACPVHTDTRGYIRAIAAGDVEKAYLIARGPNPLASICGRVCGAPCEVNCRRGLLDAPVSIRGLKRQACDAFVAKGTAELPALIERIQATTGRLECADREDVSCLASLRPATGDKPRGHGERVAIIGGGPAGLAAAHDLALLRFKPVIFESHETAGGMLTVGIPEFRLPRAVIDAEVSAILQLGVEIRCNCEVGKTISLKDIRRDFSATIIAVGAHRSKSLGIPGEDATGVLGGVEFLRNLSMGRVPKLGERVAVIGGGNTAMDCSRSSLRVGVDNVVNILYRRARDEMPVNDDELHEAQLEGVNIRFLVSPVAIESDDKGCVTGIRLQKNRLGPPDDSGRRRPEPIQGSEYVEPYDAVILAVGQESDLYFVDPERDRLTFNRWGLIDCNEETLSTNQPDVFVAGDAAYGAKLLIDAVASGKKAARSVFEYLAGESVGFEAVELHLPIENYWREKDYEKRPRLSIPTIPVAERFEETDRAFECGFSAAEAILEAERCFDCGINTIFDGTKCILCGGCADVCPELCLKLVMLDELEGSEHFESLRAQWVGFAPGSWNAIIKNDERCTRCGLCAERCPNRAITMERFTFKETCLQR